jgi:DMSO/TMAO reductase YedYZ molybdopterin-dependent catalytic subunit
MKYKSKPIKNTLLTRRQFLLVVSGGAVAVLAGCRPDSETPVPTVYDVDNDASNLASDSQSGLPEGLDPHFGRITHRDIHVTNNNIFYVQNHDGVPSLSYEDAVRDWELTVDGLVDNSTSFTYEAIRALPEIESMRTLECIGNPVGGSLIGNAVWSGFLFQEILDRVNVRASALRARFYAADGYYTAVDMRWITQPDVLMATKMNGQLLPREHGFPLRIFMPGLYGQKMPKWITRIEFIDFQFEGYWEQKGWSDTARVQTNSIIQTPPQQSEIQGQVAIQGVSYAGTRRITKVEVRIDGDQWLPATLVEGESPLVWTQWYLRWTPPRSGTYEIEVRATDDTNFTQQSESDGALDGAKPRGTNAIHRIVVKAV